ncbi:MAG: methylenetetrahydrofolate reductase [Dehalococcoidia bacterium]
MCEFDSQPSSDQPSKPPRSQPGRLEARLRASEFAVVCEMSPPRGASIEPLRRKAALVEGWVDAAVVTDGQGAQTRMAGWAGCLAVKAEGVEPVMLLQGRDRNRLALQADLLGAAGASIPNVLLQTGDHAAAGDHPEAAESFDLDSLAAIRAATNMKQHRQLMSGRELSAAPHWFIGCVENATSDDPRRVQRFEAKVEAGAQFVLTQYVFDLQRFEAWMRQVRDRGLDQRCYVLAGVGPVLTPGALRFLERLGDVHIPEATARSMRDLPENELATAGMALAVETLQALHAMPGVAGAYLLTSNHEQVVPELMTRAGIPSRQ